MMAASCLPGKGCGWFVAIRFFVYRLTKFYVGFQLIICCFAKKEFGDNNENECFSSETSTLCASENGTSHFWHFLDILFV